MAEWPISDQLDLALRLFEVPITEDKLAGVLLLQNHLRSRFDWRKLLPRYARLYEKGWIYSWNTSDWFCVRVLGPTLKEAGLPFARPLARWRTAPDLWQARSAVVPFIAGAGDLAYRPLIRTVCATLIRRPERFAKTGVGWLLRDVSRHDTAFVQAFVASHAASFSLESTRNALKYFPPRTAAGLLAAVRANPVRPATAG